MIKIVNPTDLKVQSTQRVDDIDRALWRQKVADAADNTIAKVLRGETAGLTMADLIVMLADVERCGVEG